MQLRWKSRLRMVYGHLRDKESSPYRAELCLFWGDLWKKASITSSFILVWTAYSSWLLINYSVTTDLLLIYYKPEGGTTETLLIYYKPEGGTTETLLNYYRITTERTFESSLSLPCLTVGQWIAHPFTVTNLSCFRRLHGDFYLKDRGVHSGA